MKRLTFLIAMAALALLGWRLGQPRASGPGPEEQSRSGTGVPAPATLPSGHAATAKKFPERSTLADALNDPQRQIGDDLQLLAGIIETFRTNFLRDGNPVGENVEITAALTGKNALNLALIPGNHPAINGRGELCDRWGTPFFFHQLSGTRMEIRSAGPDRRLHSADDAVLTP